MKMQMKKYEITERCLEDSRGNTLFQIKALKPFGHIKKGQLGGFISSENNLSHEGSCWVYPNASISENAKAMHNAVLRDYSSLKGNARAYNNTILLDNASLDDHACIACNVIIKNNACMKDNASAEGDDLITKSPIYTTLEHVNVTITEHYVLLDYPKDSKHYTAKEWFNLKTKKLDKICGSAWRQRYKNILDSLIHEHNQQ